MTFYDLYQVFDVINGVLLFPSMSHHRSCTLTLLATTIIFYKFNYIINIYIFKYACVPLHVITSWIVCFMLIDSVIFLVWNMRIEVTNLQDIINGLVGYMKTTWTWSVGYMKTTWTNLYIHDVKMDSQYINAGGIFMLNMKRTW